MSEHTQRVMQTYKMNLDQANLLQDDLEKACEILNDITQLAFYKRSADKKTAIRTLEEIEAKSRRARNLLDQHRWPF